MKDNYLYYVELFDWLEIIVARREVTGMTTSNRKAFAERWIKSVAKADTWTIQSYKIPMSEFENKEI